MNFQTQKELQGILKRYERFVAGIGEEIISVLKKNCKTYGEIEAQLLSLKTFLYWSMDMKTAEALSFVLEKQIQAEKNDLPLPTTNRSQIL